MKKIFSLLAAGAAAVLFCGCTVVRQQPEIPASVLANKQKAGYEYSRELVKAFIKNNASGFVKKLPISVRKEFTVEKFKATRNSIIGSIGTPVSFRYVTALEMTAVTPHIWAIRFERESRRDNKTYHSELLFRVITGELDGKPYILGFNFL